MEFNSDKFNEEIRGGIRNKAESLLTNEEFKTLVFSVKNGQPTWEGPKDIAEKLAALLADEST